MEDIIRVLELDIRGEDKNNLFDREVIKLTDKTCNYIIPDASPFFGEPDKVTLYNEKGGELKLGKDYTLEGEFIPLCEASGRSVVSFIQLSDEVVKNNKHVSVSYLSLGAYFVPRSTLEEWKDSLHTGKIPIDFEDKVHSIPEELPPSHHLHNVREEITNWYDLTYFYKTLTGLVKGRNVNILNDIDRAIEDAHKLLKIYKDIEEKRINDHDKSYNNPHGAVKGNLDLGNVPNIGTSTVEELLEGKGDDKFITLEGVKTILEGEVLDTTDLTEPGVFPLSQFGGKGYIPPSISGSFEGLGFESNSSIYMNDDGVETILTPKFDGRERAMYYHVRRGNKWYHTYHKYDHVFFRDNGVEIIDIANGSGNDVALMRDTKGRFLVGLLNGSLDPTRHVWSFVNLTNLGSRNYGLMTPVKIGNRVYFFCLRNHQNTNQYERAVGFDVCYVPVESIGKVTTITSTRISGWNYTTARGRRVTNGDFLTVAEKELGATNNRSVFYHEFTGLIPKTENMGAYTNPVFKQETPQGYLIKLCLSYYFSNGNGSTAGTLDVTYLFNEGNILNPELVNHSPFTRFLDSNIASPYPPNWEPSAFYYGGGNCNAWFDQTTNRYAAPEQRSYGVKYGDIGTLSKSITDTTNNKLSTSGYDLDNPLGITTTLGECMWFNGRVFMGGRDKNGVYTTVGFDYKEGFEVRKEVTNSKIPNIKSLPLPDKMLPVVIDTNTFNGKFSCGVVPYSESVVHNGVRCFGHSNMPSGTIIYKNNGESINVPRSLQTSVVGDEIHLKGVGKREYKDSVVKLFLEKMKGNPTQYLETKVSVYELVGSVVDGGKEIVKIPFLGVVDYLQKNSHYQTIVWFEIDKNKSVIERADVKVLGTHTGEYHTPRTISVGLQPYWMQTVHNRIKFSAKDNGKWSALIYSTQGSAATGNSVLVYTWLRSTDSNTPNPTIVASTGTHGSTAVFTYDLGFGFSPSENMDINALRRRDVTGGCAIVYDDFLFGSTYPQEGWIVYFPAEENVLIGGSTYTLPVGSIDLRDVAENPQDSTFYIYASVRGSEAFYSIVPNKLPKASKHLLVATVRTSKTKIEEIDRLQPLMVGDYLVSRFREGGIIPISTGLPQDEGRFEILEPEDVGLAKPGPPVPNPPIKPVTPFRMPWRLEHGNVGEFSWANPLLDRSIQAYYDAGYFEEDFKQYLAEGKKLEDYRLVVSEWFTYVGQSGTPENKRPHPQMDFVYNDIKKRFNGIGYVKPKTNYTTSKYLHVADTYLPTRLERIDGTDKKGLIPYKLEDSLVKAKVSNYETQTGIGAIRTNFHEYFGVSSKWLKNIDWWTGGVDLDSQRLVIKLQPFNLGGRGFNVSNEFTQQYLPLRTELERNSKYVHEYFFKPTIPNQPPNPDKVVGMFATTTTQNYADYPATPPSGKLLPSIIVKPGNGLLSKGVSAAQLARTIRGSWWEEMLNNSIADDRKFFDGRGINFNTHDLHYYIWEDVTWNGSNTRDMYNNVNARSGKDRIRVDVNQFRQAQRYFATIRALPKGHKFTSPTPLYRVTGGDLGNTDEFNTFLGHLKLGNLNSNWGEIFLNEINHLNKANMNGGDGKFITITPWLIVGRVGGGSLAEQRTRAFNERYVPKRNELLAARHYVIEHWLENEITWKGQVVGGVLIAVTLVNPPVSNLSFNVEIRAGNTGSSRDRVTGGLPDTVEQMYTKYTNLLASYDTMSTKDITTLVNNPATRYWDYMEVGKTLLEWRRRGMNKNTHKVRVTLWSEPYAELYPNSPNGRPSMRNEVVNNRKYDYVAPLVNDPAGVPDVTTRPRSSLFVSYKFIGINTARAADLPYELHNGDVGTTAEINSLFSRMKLGSLAAGWGELFLDPSRQLKPVNWYNGSINWAHHKLIIKVWTLSDHSGGAQLNGRNTGHTSLYVSKRDRLKREHAYAFEHWFDRDTTFKGRSVAGLFLTAHAERTAEPPQILRYQFWYGSRYHKGHVDSCINKYGVSWYGFSGYPQCKVTVSPPGVDQLPSRRPMAGLFSIPDNCHVVNVNIAGVNHGWNRVFVEVAPGTINIELPQVHPRPNSWLSITIANNIGERKEFRFRIG